MSTTVGNISKLHAGLAKAAAKLGSPYAVYRPSGVGPAIDPSNLVIQSMLAAFPKNYAYSAVNDPKKPQQTGIFDATKIQPGDYFVSLDGKNDIYFVSFMPVMEPILCIHCNTKLSFKSEQISKAPGSSTARPVGFIGQLGNIIQGINKNVTQLLTDWPASALYSGRGPSTLSKLPSDETSSQFTILLPPSLPIQLQSMQLVTDDILQREYVIVAAEVNEGGWRVIANQALE